MGQNRNSSRKDDTTKPIFATGWFKNHGIAYLDMVLAALEGSHLWKGKRNERSLPYKVDLKESDQYELARTVGYFDKREGRRFSTWSAVYYLVPNSKLGFDNGQVEELIEEGKWKKVLESVAASEAGWPNWEGGFDKLHAQIKENKRFPELQWFEQNWGDEGPVAMQSLWHVINEAPLSVQLEWYKRYSPVFAANRDLIQFVELSAKDIGDPAEVTQSMYKWLEKDAAGRPCVLNLWGTTTAIQFGWYYLLWQRPTLKSAVFVKCRTSARKRTKRFVPIAIDVVPSDPMAELRKLRELPARRWESPSRQSATHRLRFCFEQGDNFCILLLGGRGTGKSRAVAEKWKNVYDKRPMVPANCANFSTPEHARSELFGHEKGAFTGATCKRDGLLLKAKDGLLFLDEVHRLDPVTAGMLLTALESDPEGNFSFSPLGAKKPQSCRFQPVFASNWSLPKLRDQLGEDFVDRISQRIIEMPPIDRHELKEAWCRVWAEMNFAGSVREPIEGEEGFGNWLENQTLEGSFRDLQHIAILVADFQRDTYTENRDKTLFDWLDREMGFRRPVVESATISVPFNVEGRGTEDDYLVECRRAFAKSMKERYGSATAAVNELRSRNSNVTPSKFSNWLNSKRER